MPRLVLWDVDHTLVENAGVSKEIYAAAFVELTGHPPVQPAVTEGRTDPDIMADLLRANHELLRAWPTVREALEHAGAAHRQPMADRGCVLPGVPELVRALADAGVIQTLVTGNIRPNAEVKLASFGLLGSLDLEVGAYGSDSRERSDLVALAQLRTAAKYVAGDDAWDTVVIGDTPRDVLAARAHDARMLAVASGVHSVDELRSAGATFVLRDLRETAAAMGFVLGSPPGTL
jgi:phosphoglycolate phosphatase